MDCARGYGHCRNALALPFTGRVVMRAASIEEPPPVEDRWRKNGKYRQKLRFSTSRLSGKPYESAISVPPLAESSRFSGVFAKWA
jgi:hypothetical protein